MSAPELVHVATINVQLGSDPLMIANGPKGTRVIADVTDLVIEGQRLNARMAGAAAADWLTLGPDGTYGTLDVRVTVRTDDEVIIYCEYSGRIDLVTGRVIAAPLFQCGDEKYDWINRIQFISDGSLDSDNGRLIYQLYEVRPR